MKAIVILLFICFGSQSSWAAEDLSEGEYFWDLDPGYGKATKILIPKNSSNEFSLDISSVNLSYGIHQLGIRVKSAQNMWSSTLTEVVFVHTPLPLGDHTQLTSIEYFFENDLGLGKNKIIDISPKAILNYENIEIPLSQDIKVGTSLVNFRIKTGRGQWSSTITSPFAILENNPSRGIAKVELFLYVNDPGLDKAINLPITPINGKEVSVDYSLPVRFEGPGFSYYNFRAKDTEGRWSALYTLRFDVSAILGIEENTEVSLFPNPTDGEFEFHSISEDNEVVIIDISGKIYKKYITTANKKHSVSDLPSGKYIVNVFMKNGTQIRSFKLLKK